MEAMFKLRLICIYIYIHTCIYIYIYISLCLFQPLNLAALCRAAAISSKSVPK